MQCNERLNRKMKVFLQHAIQLMTKPAPWFMQSKMGTFPCLCPSVSLPGGSAARLADLLWTVFIKATCLGAALPWEEHFTAFFFFF